MENVRNQPTGMKAFTVVWFGQVISLLGSAMTQFALTIWAWQITGSATALALVGFFSFGPTVLISPIAGALVDRWNRKLVMMLSDLAAGLSTVAILLLYLGGHFLSLGFLRNPAHGRPSRDADVFHFYKRIFFLKTGAEYCRFIEGKS